MLYKIDSYPYGAIGKAEFMWQPRETDHEKNRKLWLWLHPEDSNMIFQEIGKANPELKRKNLDELSRFRLTGPLSQAVLREALKEVYHNDIFKE